MKSLKFAHNVAGILLASTVPFVVGVHSAQSASLVIPTTTVNSTNVFSGPTFTVNGNYAATDTLSLDVSGTVDVADFLGNGYMTNAAGVVTQYSSFFNRPAGSTLTNASISGNTSYGSLLLGNITLGFRQLFPSSAVNGAGSSNPPTALSLSNVTLGSIFGQGLSDGTVLEFRVSDENTLGNSGAFIVGSPTAVPTPALLPGLIGLGVAAIRKRKNEATEADSEGAEVKV